MNADAHWAPGCSLDMLQQRGEMFARIRRFFAARKVLEVQTPILSRHAVCDLHIDSIAACDPVRAMHGHLRTSPEYAIKRLLAAGCGDCYELGAVFRAGETGRWHNPEFTMLEWYRLGWQRAQLVQECIELLYVLHADFRDWTLRQITHSELCLEQLGCDLIRTDDACLQQLAEQHGLPAAEHWLRSQCLDYLFSHCVQTRLPSQQITIVQDFPPEQAALAELSVNAAGDQVASRFELYLGSVEIANAYQELTDAATLEARFVHDNAQRKQLGKPVIEPDQRLLAAMRHGLPACAGVAMGVDRLLAVMQGARQLGDVIGFTHAHA